MRSLSVKDFDLKYSLECGQFFRYFYDEKRQEYIVQSRDRIFRIKQKGNRIFYEGDVDPYFLKRFFRLDDDYPAIIRRISVDKHVKDAVRKYPGLRIIRQDPWECTISYICSSASNIPRIQKNIENISRSFGEERNILGFESHAFPKPGTIDCKRTINGCGVGFRNSYIIEANHLWSRKFEDLVRKSSYEEAKSMLKSVPGIGDKVADCILLFSFDRLEAFPVDVWIKRVMERIYFGGRSVSNKRIREFAQEYWGEYAGYAQQFLYHYWREKERLERKDGKTRD